MSESGKESNLDSSEQDENDQREDDEEQEELVVQMGDFEPYQHKPVGLSSDKEEHRNDTDDSLLQCWNPVLTDRFQSILGKCSVIFENYERACIR